VSFDIDGTLETGDPPGPVTLDLVRRARELGYTIGSASDRTVAYQRKMWEENGIEVDFVGHKHHLEDIVSRFDDITRKVHIGDTEVDKHYSTKAGLEFVFAVDVPEPGTPDWIW
jgi:hypothetical protein